MKIKVRMYGTIDAEMIKIALLNADSNIDINITESSDFIYTNNATEFLIKNASVNLTCVFCQFDRLFTSMVFDDEINTARGYVYLSCVQILNIAGKLADVSHELECYELYNRLGYSTYRKPKHYTVELESFERIEYIKYDDIKVVKYSVRNIDGLVYYISYAPVMVYNKVELIGKYDIKFDPCTPFKYNIIGFKEVSRTEMY